MPVLNAQNIAHIAEATLDFGDLTVLLETHSARIAEVSTVIAKRKYAIDQLRGHVSWHLSLDEPLASCSATFNAVTLNYEFTRR